MSRAHLGPCVVALVASAACGGPVEPTPQPSPTVDACTSPPSQYAKAVIEWWVPACSLAQDIYNDPLASLGPPDAAGQGPYNFTGFISMGFGGHVTLDMGGCIADAAGNDLRVFQAVGSEPVSVYVSLAPDGPFTLLAARETCGNFFDARKSYCDFDLAAAGVSRARYIRVEDGELFPCPGGTVSEGADLDAVQALGVSVAASPPR